MSISHSSSADYIASLREKLRAACHNAGTPELAEVAEAVALSFRIGESERAGGTPSKQRPERVADSSSRASSSASDESSQLGRPRPRFVRDQTSRSPQPSSRPRPTNVLRPATLMLHQNAARSLSPADEGAGRRLPKSVRGYDEAGTTEEEEELSSEAPTEAWVPHDEGTTVQAPPPPAPEQEENVEAVANAVLRLRSQKRNHDEAQDTLEQAKDQLRRVPPHCLLQLHGYLELNLGDPVLSVQVQDAIVKLVEALCLVCHIELTCSSPDGVLQGSRLLLRDPHSFTQKLCSLEPMSQVEARSLAPCLLYASQYRKVRERDVNLCCEALQAWVSAYYFFSNIYDHVQAVAQELEAKEALLAHLARLGGPSLLAPGPAGPSAHGAGGRNTRAEGHRRSTDSSSSSTTTTGLTRSTMGLTRSSIDPAAVLASGGGRRISKSPTSAGAGSARGPTGNTAGPSSRRAGASSSSSVAASATSPKARTGSTAGGHGPSHGGGVGGGGSGLVRRTSGPGANTLRSSASNSGDSTGGGGLGVQRQQSDRALSSMLRSSAGGGGGGGVQRMQSDKALASMLRSSKDVGRSNSPEAPSSSSAMPSSAGPSHTSHSRLTRQPPGGLAPVPERRVSLPPTLLEAANMRGGPAGAGSPAKDAHTRRAPLPTRSVTAVPRF